MTLLKLMQLGVRKVEDGSVWNSGMLEIFLDWISERTMVTARKRGISQEVLKQQVYECLGIQERN